MKKIFFLLLTLLLVNSVYSQYDRTKVTSQLSSILDNTSETEMVRVLFLLEDRVDVESLSNELVSRKIGINERAPIIIEALKQKAVSTQQPLLDRLSYLKFTGSVEEYHSFWITNVISATVNVRMIKYLTYRDDIELIEVDNELIFEEGVNSSPALDNITGSEIGLRVIKADVLWRLGFTGQGRLAMNIDSGIDGNHPALKYKWRGLVVPWYHAWLDAQGSSFPTWCSSHGSHTIGTMCGLDTTTADTVGVCPDAEWMAAKRHCSGNYSTFGIIAFQWAMDPDSNSATNDMPDAVNCSHWTNDPTSNQCNGTYKITLISVEAVGIGVVYSAGNGGPGASTITSPKNINTTLVNIFCAGAINGNNSSYPIASFSSRGPSICGGSGGYLIKPEASAPGVSVRSCNPNNQYGYSSGTSMAAPHIAGSVVLLRSFAPNLTGSQIKLGLYLGATDLGTPGEDNTYGMGLINVYKAMILLGPQITHTPLNDTTNLNGPYRVNATITPSTITNSNIDTTSVKLFWGRNTLSDSITMQRVTDSTWYADIPGNGSAVTYVYFIRAFDELEVRGQSPGDAPLNLHSFNAGLVNITGNELNSPKEYKLRQNYPNPFNPVTNLNFELPKSSGVKLVIYNALGEEIVVLVNEYLEIGRYSIEWNASDYPSGVYFYKLISNKFTGVKKMILIK